MILEMCIHRMEEYSNALWNGEPIVLTFSRQDQYAKFAEKLWRAHKDTGLWGHIVGFAYGDPELPELQAADMLVYEAFQCVRQVHERGEAATPHVRKKWPLMRRLVGSQKTLLADMMNEKRLIEMLRKEDKNRRYLARPDTKKKS